MYASKEQIIAINTALHKKALMHRKAEIIGGLTNGRTESSKELLFAEAHALLTDLNKNNVTDDQGKRMRNNIIAMAHELNWIRNSQAVDKTGRVIIVKDYARLDNWMLKFSYLKKKLFDYKYEELPTLVTQFKNVYSSTLKNK